MVCCACFKADAHGWLITDKEEDKNVHWVMCIECLESYHGQAYLFSHVEVE